MIPVSSILPANKLVLHLNIPMQMTKVKLFILVIVTVSIRYPLGIKLIPQLERVKRLSTPSAVPWKSAVSAASPLCHFIKPRV